MDGPFPRCQVQGGAVVAEEVCPHVDLRVLAMGPLARVAGRWPPSLWTLWTVCLVHIHMVTGRDSIGMNTIITQGKIICFNSLVQAHLLVTCDEQLNNFEMSLWGGQIQWRFAIAGTRVDVKVTALMEKWPCPLQITPFRGTQELGIGTGAWIIFCHRYVG